MYFIYLACNIIEFMPILCLIFFYLLYREGGSHGKLKEVIWAKERSKFGGAVL